MKNLEKLKAKPGESKYIDFDEITESYAIFGLDSGFCYQHGFGTEKEAEDFL